MTNSVENGPAQNGSRRKSERVECSAEVTLRRPGVKAYRVQLLDLSPYGCKAEFVERPQVGELVWLKFESLEALEAIVCWLDGFEVGLEFRRPIHEAVFASLVSRLDNPKRSNAE